MPQKTRVRQSQIKKSETLNDSLSLPSYGDITTLEGDLNYLRSILKEMKGTGSYDTPLGITLAQLETNLTGLLSGETLTDIHLDGIPTASVPQPGDDSNRVATTSFVQSVISAAGGGSGDKYVKIAKDDSTVLNWTINHGMGKKPSVTFVDSSKREQEVGVTYIDINSLTVHFSYQVSGYAYLN
jgi:hypothetical protein